MSLVHAGQQPSTGAGNSPAAAIGVKLVDEFREAETAKKLVEPRLLKCLRQYKGIYDPDVLKRIKKGRATTYIRHTAAKVDSTKARLMDLLFPSNGALNWEITPSVCPTLNPVAVEAYVAEMTAKNEPVPTDKEALNRAAAARACELMSKKIADQLMEPTGKKSYERVCERVILNGTQYGTGILKGPLVSRKEQQRYSRTVDAEGKAIWTRVSVDPDEEYKPFFSSVSVWSLFPDPSALDPEDLLYVWEEHTLTRSDLKSLGRNPGFRAEIISAYVSRNPDGDATLTDRQQELRNVSADEGSATPSKMKNRYRVLERWGYLNGDEIVAAGVSADDLALAFPEGFDESGSYPSCVWMTPDGHVIKASLAPIEGVALPYHFFQPYKDESSFWAEGLCDRIRDPQTSINAMARMTLDHASITTLPQVGVNMSALAAGEKPDDFTAGKVWMFESDQDMNNCMRFFGMDSHIPEIMAIGEKFSQWSDETSSPRYMTGDNAGVRGAGDTAAGLSMLMGAASLPSKDQVRQFDALTENFISLVYNWNMKFSKDERIKGDFDIVARGSTALIAQELQGQHMLQVMSILAAPMMQGKVDWDFVLKHVLHYMSLPEGARMDPAAVKAKELEMLFEQKKAVLAAIIDQAKQNGIAPALILQQFAAQLLGQAPQAQVAGAPGAEEASGVPGPSPAPPPPQAGSPASTLLQPQAQPGLPSPGEM